MKILKEGIKEYARRFECECKMCNTQVEITWGDPVILGFSRSVDGNRYIYLHTIKWACPVCEYENVTENRSGSVRMLNHSQREEREMFKHIWYRDLVHVNEDVVEQKDMPDGIDVSWYKEDGTKEVTDEDLANGGW